MRSIFCSYLPLGTFVTLQISTLGKISLQFHFSLDVFYIKTIFALRLLRINLNKHKPVTAIPLSDLTVGQKRKVYRFEDEQLGGKLMAMGMLPGASIELVRTAIAGNTLYIKFNGYSMAIRRSEAMSILLD